MIRSLVLVAVLGFTTIGAPILSIEKECCGQLDITTYEKVVVRDFEKLRFSGGLVIEADWKGKKPAAYHFLSAITKDDSPPKYVDGSALPIPYADTPPGGYQHSTWPITDYSPWYPYESGAGTDKHFEDAPRNPFGSLFTFKDGKIATYRPVDVFFETWLVCTLERKGKKPPVKGPAKDTSYKVAPLAGFTWGFTLFWDDVDKNGELDPGLLEIDVKLKPLNALAAPSASMTKAFSKTTTYGKTKDFFDVTFAGTCKDCMSEVPEPVSLSYVVLGVLILMVRRWRYIRTPA